MATARTCGIAVALSNALEVLFAVIMMQLIANTLCNAPDEFEGVKRVYSEPLQCVDLESSTCLNGCVDTCQFIIPMTRLSICPQIRCGLSLKPHWLDFRFSPSSLWTHWHVRGMISFNDCWFPMRSETVNCVCTSFVKFTIVERQTTTNITVKRQTTNTQKIGLLSHRMFLTCLFIASCY